MTPSNETRHSLLIDILPSTQLISFTSSYSHSGQQEIEESYFRRLDRSPDRRTVSELEIELILIVSRD